MGYIILFFIFVNTTIAYANLFKRKFEETVIFTVVTYITVLFLTGILGNLNVGFYMLIIANVIALVNNIYSIIKKKISLKNQIFTFGFIVFVLSYMLILWISVGRKAVEWDEFSHWALAVKNMFALNNLGLGEGSNILFKNYLSGTSIFQFFCTKVSGEFKEGMLYVGMNLMIVSTIIPIFKNVKSRRSLISYICYGIMFFVPMYFYPTIYKTIYVDGILALVFAYTLYSYFSDYEEGLSKFKLINLAISFMFLVLIKDFGIVFAAGSLFIILVDNLFVRNKFKIKSLWKNSNKLILTAIPMLMIKIIWIIILKSNNIVARLDTSNIMPTILNFFKGNLLPYQITTKENYITALFEKPLTEVYSFTFVMCICLAVILAYIVRKNTNNKKGIQVMLSLSIIGAGAYAFLLLFVPFLALFSEYEALNLASYSRYMSSYILGLIFMELALIIREISIDNNKFERFTLSIFAIFIFSFPFTYIEQFTIFARELNLDTIEKRSSFDTFNKVIKENVKHDEKIYFIATNTIGYEYYIARYEATPIGFSEPRPRSWSISDKPYSETDIWTTVKSAEEWKIELIDNYDYVYLYMIDEVFLKNYGNLFCNTVETIENNQLYKVNKTVSTDKILELVTE